VSEYHGLVRAAEAVVAHPLGKVGPVVEAVSRMEVRAADPAVPHGETNLSVSGRRLGPLDDGKLGLSADDGPHL
jgi:hypothetical protein